MSAELDELKRQEAAADAVAKEIRARRAAAEEKLLEERLEPFKELAILAHETLCSWNHTDGCGWGYEMQGNVHNWKAWAHARWLKKIDELVTGKPVGGYGTSNRVMDAKSPEAIREIIEAVGAMKAKHRDALWMIRSGLEPS